MLKQVKRTFGTPSKMIKQVKCAIGSRDATGNPYTEVYGRFSPPRSLGNIIFLSPIHCFPDNITRGSLNFFESYYLSF